MKLQYLCHLPTVLVSLSIAVMAAAAEPARNDASGHDYPTLARVEYVNQCIAKHGGKLAALYQCSCAIDRIAEKLTFDDYVESTTFVNNANMPGEGGGMFRDSERGHKMTKSYRELEAESLRGCGMTN